MAQNKTYDVLVAGELNVDLIVNQLQGYPEVGKEILAERMTLTLGSSAAIFACNLSILGAKVAFAGKVGQDSFAGRILADLAEKGVDTSHILSTSTANTGISIALNYREDRAMITYPGAMEELVITDITDEALLQANHLHVSSLFLQKGLKPDIVALYKRAREAGMTTSLDPQWDPAQSWEIDLPVLLPYVDVFLPNMEEFKRITHQPDLRSGIEMVKEHAGIIVVKDGNKGAYAWKEGRLLHQPPFLNKQVVDCIGAGDSFDAGFIKKYTAGRSLEECLEFAALTGALNTTAAGGTTAFSDYGTIRSVAQETFSYAIR
ncbi:MAG TPA: carbohydrate kinase family protein [Chitinophagaceae bacterium]|nr:carbohydrate kinase family protein [Chitinophagaceae bacterium]